MNYKIFKNKKGASITEYGILAGLVAVTTITSAFYLGRDVSEPFDTAAQTLISAQESTQEETTEITSPPSIVNESERNCITEQIGYDDFQESDGGRSSYTFPGDCLLITEDGDVTFHTMDSIHPGKDFYVRVNTSPSSEVSSISFEGGPSHTILVEQGPISLAFVDTTGDVHLPGVDTQRDFMRIVGQRGFITTAIDGSQMSFDMLYVHPDSIMSGPSSDINFHFADQTLTSSQLKPIIYEKMTTPGNDSIDGTDTSDVIYLDEGGMDNLNLYSGDNSVYWSSGSFDIRPSVNDSEDTLYIPNVSINNATPSLDGFDYLLTLDDGRTARLLFADLYADNRKGIDKIVFSLDNVEVTDLKNYFNPDL